MSAFKLLTDLVRNARRTQEQLAMAAYESLQTILKASQAHQGDSRELSRALDTARQVAEREDSESRELRTALMALTRAAVDRETRTRGLFEIIDKVGMVGVGALQLEDVSRQTLERAEDLAVDLDKLLDDVRAEDPEVRAKEKTILDRSRERNLGLETEGEKSDEPKGPAIELF